MCASSPQINTYLPPRGWYLFNLTSLPRPNAVSPFIHIVIFWLRVLRLYSFIWLICPSDCELLFPPASLLQPYYIGKRVVSAYCFSKAYPMEQKNNSGSMLSTVLTLQKRKVRTVKWPVFIVQDCWLANAELEPRRRWQWLLPKWIVVMSLPWTITWNSPEYFSPFFSFLSYL